MKAQLLAQWARIDKLSLRERIILFLSILACFGVLLDTLWLSPAQVDYQQTQVRFDKQNAELLRLRDTLRASARPSDVNQPVRAELNQTQAKIDEVNQAVARLQPGTAGSTPLAQALVHLLQRHEGLTLVRTIALAPEIAGPGNSNGAASLPVGLTRQGVALTVVGPYAELMRYVASLETAMPYVRWGALTLAADGGQSELKLQLFLLGETAR